MEEHLNRYRSNNPYYYRPWMGRKYTVKCIWCSNKFEL
jgi:hypothetical protein